MMNFSVVDEAYDPKITTSYFLSIQVTLDGFSFCTLDPVTNRYIQIQHFAFIEGQTIDKQVSGIFNQIEKLSFPYKKTLILLPSEISTRIPAPLFDPDAINEYLSFCQEVPTSHVVWYNKLKVAGAFNIFPVNPILHELLSSQFPDPKYFHQVTPIIESFLSSSFTKADNTVLFVNLARGYFDLAAFANNNLKMCNTFHLTSENDFLFYILYTLDQMKLKPESTELMVSGTHKNFDNMVIQLSRYVRRVKQSSLPPQYQYSNKFREIHNFSAFYNLLSLPTCV